MEFLYLSTSSTVAGGAKESEVVPLAQQKVPLRVQRLTHLNNTLRTKRQFKVDKVNTETDPPRFVKIVKELKMGRVHVLQKVFKAYLWSGTLSKKIYGIIWEFSQMADPPTPFGNPLF